MPRTQKNPQKVAEGLAKGLTQMKACEEAGYSPMTAQKKGYAIVKRAIVQSALTEALERQGVTFDRILQPVVDALDATVAARTLAGPVQTNCPIIGSGSKRTIAWCACTEVHPEPARFLPYRPGG
jgi:phage terminase small subunit